MQNYLKCVAEDKQMVNNLFNTLGITVDCVGGDKCVLKLPVKPLLLQGAKIVSGGIIATLADEAMAHCVIAGLDDNQKTATIEMNIRYLRSIAEGEMIATAKIIRRGRSVVTTEAEVCNQDGKLLAVAGASFSVR